MSRLTRVAMLLAFTIVMIPTAAVAETPPGVSTPEENAAIPFNEQPITASGESPVGELIVVRDGSTELCTTTVAQPDGSWNCSLPQFSPGPHQIEVTQSAAGGAPSDPTTVHFTIGPSDLAITTARFTSPSRLVVRGIRDQAGSSGVGYTVSARVQDPSTAAVVPMTCATVGTDRFVCTHVFGGNLATGTSTLVQLDEIRELSVVRSLSRTVTVSAPPSDPGSGTGPPPPPSTPPGPPITPPGPGTPPPPGVTPTPGPTTPIDSPAHPPPPSSAPPPPTSPAPITPPNIIVAAPPAPPVTPPDAPVSPAPADDLVADPPATPPATLDDVLPLLLLAVIAFAILAMIGPRGLAFASDPVRRQRERSPLHSPGDHVGGLGFSGNPLDPDQAPPATDGAGASLTLAALAAGGSREQPDRGSDDGRRYGIAWGDKSPSWQFPGWKWIDKMSRHAPTVMARRLPLVARIGADATYLRAALGSVWLLFPALGVAVGVYAAMSTHGLPVAPSTGITTALLVLALLDATSGAVAVLGFTAVVLARGGLTADGLSLADGMRGLLGLAALWFAIPLIAAAARPFRRLAQPHRVYGWDRVGDAVIASLVGGWAVLGVVRGHSDLLGRPVAVSHHAGALAFLTIGVVLARMVVEETVAIGYPARLRAVQYVEPFPEPTPLNRLRGILTRGALMGLFASAVIGTCWQLWTGVALYVVPQVATLVEDRLPNLVALHRRLPRGIVEIMLMLVVGAVLARLIDSTYSDEPSRALRDGFLLLALPGFVLTTLGILGRSSPAPPWTWPRQLAGAVIVLITVVLALVLL